MVLKILGQIGLLRAKMADAFFIKIGVAWVLEEDAPSAHIVEIWVIRSKSVFNYIDTDQAILKQEWTHAQIQIDIKVFLRLTKFLRQMKGDL